MISIDAVTKRYGTKTAVSDLTLNIGAGQIFAFLGPNGAGKTTTIKMLVGLLRPTVGTLHVNGINVELQPQDANRLVGYVPGNYTCNFAVWHTLCFLRHRCDFYIRQLW